MKSIYHWHVKPGDIIYFDEERSNFVLITKIEKPKNFRYLCNNGVTGFWFFSTELVVKLNDD